MNTTSGSPTTAQCCVTTDNTGQKSKLVTGVTIKDKYFNKRNY